MLNSRTSQMKQLTLILILTLWAAAVNGQSDDLRISGYVQALPVWIRADLPDPFENDSFWEYRLQNRVNLNWYLSSSLTFNWEMRTRLFAGDLVNELNKIQGLAYSDLIDRDEGLVNLSWVISDHDKWLLHYIPDRLNMDWNNNDWRITVGRQRVNWGVNTVTNPNDLFNLYSFYDFDYPERPGTDAVRVQHYMGWASKIEVAYSPAREAKNSIAAGMYAFNTRGYDIQVITGYYRHRLAIGGGWAGSIRQTGFKGEVMMFTDIEELNGERSINLVAALSADHMFENSLFLVAEILYNLDGGRDQFLLLGEPLSADNPSFSRFQLTVQGSYPISPILSGSAAAIYYPDQEAIFFSPSLSWSVTQNLDLNVLCQIFAGSDSSSFSDAGNVFAGSLKWYF